MIAFAGEGEGQSREKRGKRNSF